MAGIRSEQATDVEDQGGLGLPHVQSPRLDSTESIAMGKGQSLPNNTRSDPNVFDHMAEVG